MDSLNYFSFLREICFFGGGNNWRFSWNEPWKKNPYGSGKPFFISFGSQDLLHCMHSDVPSKKHFFFNQKWFQYD